MTFSKLIFFGIGVFTLFYYSFQKPVPSKISSKFSFFGAHHNKLKPVVDSVNYQHATNPFLNTNIGIAKLATCETTFAKALGDTNRKEVLKSIINLPNGNFILGGGSGDKALLMEMNTTGDILWEKTIEFSNFDNNVENLVLSSDDHLVGIAWNQRGTSELRECFIFKYDYLSHTIKWAKKIQDPKRSVLLSLIENNKGDYVITGQLQESGGTDCDALFLVLDKDNGNELIKRELNLGACESMASIIQRPNGNYYTTGRYVNELTTDNSKMRPAVTALNQDGDELSTDLYLVDSDLGNARLYSNDLLWESGNLIILGQGDFNGSSLSVNEIFLFSIKEDNKNLNWARRYDIPGARSERTIKIVSFQDGYLILGNADFSGTNKGFLIKTDWIGNHEWTKVYSVGTNDQIYDLCLQGGFIYLVGHTSNLTANTPDLLILKLTKDGTLLSDCVYLEEPNTIQSDVLNPSKHSVSLKDSDLNAIIENIIPSIADSNTPEEIRCPSFLLADVYPELEEVNCDAEGVQIKVTICNQGDADLSQETPITFYDTDPTKVNALLVYQDVLNIGIKKDSCFLFEFFLPFLNGEIFFVLNDDNSIPTIYDLENDFPATSILECDYSNNIGSFEIEYWFLDTPDLGADTVICNNGAIELNAGPGYDSYLWSTGEVEQSYTVTETGWYWVEVTGPCDQLERDSIFVEIIPTIVLDLPEIIEICHGDSILLNVPGFVSYNWFPDHFIDCNDCDSIIIVPTDTATIFLIVESEQGCHSNDRIKILVNDKIEAFEEIYICEEDSTFVNGEWLKEAGNYQYEIESNTTCDTIVNLDLYVNTLEEIIETYDLCKGEAVMIFGDSMYEAGDYNFMFPGTNNECDTTALISINMFDPPDAAASTSPTCLEKKSGSIELTPHGGNPPYGYLWSNGQETPNLQNLDPGIYALTLSDNQGCSKALSYEINELETPDLEIINETQLIFGETTEMEISIFPNQGLSYLWTPPEGLSCTTCPEPMVDILQNMTYTLTVINEAGCVVEDKISLRVKKDFKVYIPEIFSPNDDGINDLFTIYADKNIAQILSLRIYDRWGESLYHLQNFKPNDPSIGWDGTYRGQQMNLGVFVYTVEVLFTDGSRAQLSGDFTMIR